MLTACSSWVMRVLRFSWPVSKILRSSAPALIACSYESRALVRSGSCSMNAVAFLVNSFSASVYVVMVGDDDDGWWPSARTFRGPTAESRFSNRLSIKDSISASPSDSNSESDSGCARIASSCFFHIASPLLRGLYVYDTVEPSLLAERRQVAGGRWHYELAGQEDQT